MDNLSHELRAMVHNYETRHALQQPTSSALCPLKEEWSANEAEEDEGL
jgi:hypothetical protein